MKRMLFVTSLATLALGAGGRAWAGDLDPTLEGQLLGAGPNDVLSALVFLKDQVDINGLNQRLDAMMADRQLRHKMVVESLQNMAASTQGPILAYLEQEAEEGGVEDYHAYFISNSVRVDAVPSVIYALVAREDVEIVYANYEIELVAPAEENGVSGPNQTDAPEPGIRHIQADRVWNELGITGEGVLVATLDTGVEGTHPALRDRWRGLDDRYQGNPEWAWFDPVTNTRFPQAFGGHGTHTMGTVCGGFPGDEVGVAPGATWIHAAVIDRISIPRTVADALLAFEWMLDPDEDPNTDFDVPQVCSNSWRLVTGHGYPPCERTFWAHLDANEAAGTIILFSAGNEGPGANSIGRPPDRATTDYDTLAVGACNGNNDNCPMAGFSSRGPSNCTPNGQPAVKPEITAPGENVRSSLPGGGYGNLSGTSMASPHINGVVALMREANKDLSGNDIKQIMYDTATDRGLPGDDNDYGNGVVNAYEAVIEVMGDPSPFACCFNDGGCENLFRSDCTDRGGKSRFGETCDTFQCPQPGACCIDDATCDFILERDCIAQGGDFIGEGEDCHLACPCDLIKKMKVSCRGSGTIKALVKLKNDSRNGETLKIQVGDRLRFDVPIRGKKATLYTCCFNGPQQITLLEPSGCFDPKVVDCPE